MYGKVINGTLRSSPKKVTHNGHLIYNPPPDILKELGYLPVTKTPMPTAPEGYHYESSYIQKEEEIIQEWTLVEDVVYIPEPTTEERIDLLESAMEDMIITMMGG